MKSHATRPVIAATEMPRQPMAVARGDHSAPLNNQNLYISDGKPWPSKLGARHGASNNTTPPHKKIPATKTETSIMTINCQLV